MPRILHGSVVSQQMVREAQVAVATSQSAIASPIPIMRTLDETRFDFLFPDLQNDPNNLLEESLQTLALLDNLAESMRDFNADDPQTDHDSAIPAIYTYFGQFVDHDITFETKSADLQALTSPNLTPMSVNDILSTLSNSRSGTLDLDSLYEPPAPPHPNNPEKMKVGTVASTDPTKPFSLRPVRATGDDFNDLPREGRSNDPEHDRAAELGDPRNDENTVISQLHTAFLRAHNALIDQGHTLDDAKQILRQHYQHIVLHDFLKRIAGEELVDKLLAQPSVEYDGLAEPFFMPLEFSVAAYRFGHSMVRLNYDFNLNFNRSGQPNTTPASLGLLFTFTALSGQLPDLIGGGDFDTLPDNWIIEWEHFIDGGQSAARKLDTRLVEPLFELPDVLGQLGKEGSLARRNLRRGYLLRMPTGQAVARALGLQPLTPAELQGAAAAVREEQRVALVNGGFDQRTPLWYYILAEASVQKQGQSLGEVGGTIVATVLIELVRRSKDSILRAKGWKPSLPVRPGADPEKFILADLLALANVLSQP